MIDKGIFIVFEGIDGSGKSYLINAVAKELGDRCIVTREPAGSDLGVEINKLLADETLVTSPYTELFLYEAARVENINKVILPALMEGKIVLCDRFTDSSLAYQGNNELISEKTIKQLNDIAAPIKPNLTIWVNPDVDTAMTRSKKSDHRDLKEKEFYENLQKRYSDIYKDRSNCFEIKSNGAFEETLKKTMKVIEQHIK